VGVKECPHCGNLVPSSEARCTCGFPFPDDGTSLAGAKAARVVSARVKKKKAAKKKRSWKWGGGSEDDRDEEVSQALEKLEDPSTGGWLRPPEESSKEGWLRPADEPSEEGWLGSSGESVSEKVPKTSKVAQLIRCSSCKSKISRRASACPKCGVAPWGQCGVCGAQIRAGCSVCTECGDPDPFNP